MSAVCLQPLSVDLWLQVLIMAANFQRPCGICPHHSLLLSLWTYCAFVCVCMKRDKVSSWAISCLAPVCVCMFLPQVDLMWIQGECEKPKRRLTVGKPLCWRRGDEAKAWLNTGTESSGGGGGGQMALWGPMKANGVSLFISVYVDF